LAHAVHAYPPAPCLNAWKPPVDGKSLVRFAHHALTNPAHVAVEQGSNAGAPNSFRRLSDQAAAIGKHERVPEIEGVIAEVIPVRLLGRRVEVTLATDQRQVLESLEFAASVMLLDVRRLNDLFEL